MKDLKWPYVAVVLGALGAVTWLTYTGKDSTVILVLLGALGFAIYQQTQIKETAEKIRDNTNGTNADLMRRLDAQEHRHREDMAAKDRLILQLQRDKTELAFQIQPPPVPAENVEDKEKAPAD